MSKVFDIGVAIVFVAAILVLTRPGSQGPGLVSALGNAFTGALGTATGGGSYHTPIGPRRG